MACKLKSIDLLSDLKDLDIFDSNIDLSVELDDGHNFIVVVATQKNLLTLMDMEKSDFLSPGDPMIIVLKLTKEIIESAIRAYIEDRNNGYYLKLYAAQLAVKTLDILKNREVARAKFLDDLIETPPSTEHPSQRMHSAETAPALPKQELNTSPIPRVEALTGSVIFDPFWTFLIKDRLDPIPGPNSPNLDATLIIE